jgi:hypothetical protein
VTLESDLVIGELDVGSNGPNHTEDDVVVDHFLHIDVLSCKVDVVFAQED